jgi:hypothetical protein
MQSLLPVQVTVQVQKRLRAQAFDVLLQRDAQWFTRRGHDPAALATRLAHGYERQEGRRYGAQLQQLVALGYRTLAAYSVRLKCLPTDGCPACTSC